jgi:two-component system, OmpR family, aerobic respiration control sensor histidine kinase ArcB
LGNAIKFTSKGSVEVGVDLVELHKNNAILTFHVTDTGIGIPLELQDKVFDRFFRVTPSYKGIYTGHGVGLHIAQSYAHLLGGDIRLSSEPNVGTSFYFDLTLTIVSDALLKI